MNFYGGLVGVFDTMRYKIFTKKRCMLGVWKWVGWLISVPPVVGWDIMGNESEPLHYYQELSNCSYSIKLKYTTSLSTTQVH